MNIKDKNKARERLRAGAPLFARRIAPVYVLLQWRWACEGGLMKVPTLNDIEESLFEKINTVKAPGYISSGGLRVKITEEKDGSVSTSISFESKEYY